MTLTWRSEAPAAAPAPADTPAWSDDNALKGPGPWTLVEVADAAGVSYDAVYRDVQRNILTARLVRRGAGRLRYVVTIVSLRRSARACYRHIPSTLATAPAAQEAAAARSARPPSARFEFGLQDGSSASPTTSAVVAAGPSASNDYAPSMHDHAGGATA